MSDIFNKEDIGDVDLFILKNTTKQNSDIQNFEFIREIICKYFNIESYLIVDNEYSLNDETTQNISQASVLTLKINDRINFQVIMTNFSTVQQVLDSFDFDYISVAIYKNKIYGEETSSLSWKEKRVLLCKTTDIYNHRFIKTLKKRICMPLYKTSNISPILHREVSNLLNINIVPIKERETTLPIDFTQLKIFRIEKEGLIRTSHGELISTAHFVLSDGNNTFITSTLAVNRSDNFTRPKYYSKNSKIVLVKPYISYRELKGELRFFITDGVDKDIEDYVIPFELNSSQNFDFTSEELMQYAENKCSYSSNKIVISAWSAFLNSLKKGESFSEAAHIAIGTYYYDTQKLRGISYYPYDLNGKIILPKNIPDSLSLSFLELYIR